MSLDMPCRECRGAGKIPCPVCGGSKRDPRNRDKECGFCNGTGKKECGVCDGKGRVPASHANL